MSELNEVEIKDELISKKTLSDAVKALPEEKREEAIRILMRIGLGQIVGKTQANGNIIKIHRPKSKNIPQEYYLIAQIKCNICNTIIEQYFHMKWDEEQYALISHPITERPTEFKLIKSSNYQCVHCYTVLSQMTQDELIKKVFEMAMKNRPW